VDARPEGSPALTLLTVLALAAATTLSGCGSGTGSAPRVLASAFAEAITSGDPARACSVLAPSTRSELEQSAGEDCPEALTGERLPDPGALRRVATYGSMAEATFEGDVLFLTEFPSGWRVLAAGCTARPGQPYDCRLQGG
jgi:hypothetical protein